MGINLSPFFIFCEHLSALKLHISRLHPTELPHYFVDDQREYGGKDDANKDYTYYYTPALAVYGKEKFYEKDTGEEIEWFEYTYPYPHESTCLFWINAIDGSIITN